MYLNIFKTESIKTQLLSKKTDSSAILNKSKLHYKNITLASQHDNSILPLLYSAAAYTTRHTPTPASLAAMMHSIEPREIPLNSRVDDLLKKFATESKPSPKQPHN